MITRLLLYPPLAFGRLGPSATPCDNYEWGPNDLSPRGTGKTTAVPAETLTLADDGTLTSIVPGQLVFKDAAGFRPVCPFFELHAEWDGGGDAGSGPVTPELLDRFGHTLADLTWTVEVANLKPFHYTLEPGDRVTAEVTLSGDQTARRPLLGRSPSEAANPLATLNDPVPLGSVQLTRPTDDFPELRLRFTPAAGHVYGPTNLATRTEEYRLPDDRLILNPDATWCRFVLTADDPRTNPQGLFAGVVEPVGGVARYVSLGLIDDVCDGVVTCALEGATMAVARVAVGPPSFAPDRRPLVTIAEGLLDRVDRTSVADPAYVSENEELTALEVRDLMERALETMANMNVDVQTDRSRRENAAIALAQGLPPDDAADRTLPPVPPVLGRPLPLTEMGRQRHRRFVALEVFEDILREQPELLDQRVREPLTRERYYDRGMPYVMRGSDRYPLHLTRRQYALLEAWARHLRKTAEEGT
ncbi:MAG: hypothetical protein M3144_02755 [Actinomycetota bacterium]|nr:hypothetical protein [Actinomycetota bacterium]